MGRSRETLGFTEAGKSLPPRPAHRGAGFYLIVLALCVSSIMSAIDMTGLGTILPTIAADLNSKEYSWIGSAFVLTSTAFIPITTSFANIFGRRPTLLAGLVAFSIGSAICGSAPTMEAMIIGRAVQGAGGGCIIVMTEIIIVDLVPLAERGAFFGIIGATWSISAGVGPPIGGVLAEKSGLWRWFFYLNLPILALAIVLVACFLNVKTPKTTFREKMGQMDWYNIIFVGSTTSCIIAMSWAGDTYSWSSWKVYSPLSVGMIGLIFYILLERSFAPRPTIPFQILTHKLTVLGYLTNFIHGMTVLVVIYYIPTFYQACLGHSPIRGGIDLFSLSFTIAPFGMIAGMIVTVTTKYKWLNVVGWIMTCTGLGLMSMIKYNSPTAMWVGFPVLFGCGAGILFCAPLFPILAPLQLNEQPPAMAFHAFTRLFGNTWGVSIGITVLQDQLRRRLPAAFLKDLGRTTGIVYAAVPSIPHLPEPVRTEVKKAYAGALSTLWLVMTGLAGIGLIAALFLQDIGLADEVDSDWGLNDVEITQVELSRVSTIDQPRRPSGPHTSNISLPPNIRRMSTQTNGAARAKRWSTQSALGGRATFIPDDGSTDDFAKRMSRRMSTVSSHALRM
ncbi:iron permease [Meredithblackwellia eburnea MCA 4105]